MIGKYGGTIRRGFKGVSDRWGPTKHIDRCLVWFDKDLVMQPRLAESWEFNADASEWTFHLREGTNGPTARRLPAPTLSGGLRTSR